MSNRHGAEEIVAKPRRVEVLHGQGLSMAAAIRRIGVSEPTFRRRRKTCAGMQAERLKELDTRKNLPAGVAF